MMVVVCNSKNHKRKGKDEKFNKIPKKGKDWVVLRRRDIYLLDINLGICPFITSS
jgi:hypothetical protein